MMQMLLIAAALPFARGPKLRTCAAMLAGNAVSWLLPPLSLPDNSWVLGMYILLDLATAVIITRKPAGHCQQTIGLLFAIMVLFHIGFLIRVVVSNGVPNPMLYWETVHYVGWVQVVLLITWSVWDAVLQPVLDRRRTARLGVSAPTLAQ